METIFDLEYYTDEKYNVTIPYPNPIFYNRYQQQNIKGKIGFVNETPFILFLLDTQNMEIEDLSDIELTRLYRQKVRERKITEANTYQYMCAINSMFADLDKKKMKLMASYIIETAKKTQQMIEQTMK